MTHSNLDNLYGTFDADSFTQHIDLFADGLGAVHIPDANLIFSGSYFRTGFDLVIKQPFETVTIHDYFKLAVPPAIEAPGPFGPGSGAV